MPSLKLVTPPPIEPITLADAKAHLRVSSTDEDALITSLIVAARAMTEAATKRALIRQTWDWTLDRFPAWFEVPLPPLQSVLAINYLDTANTPQVVDPTTYIVDANLDQGRINLNYARVWPWSFPVINAVTVRFVAGYPSDGGSPEDLTANVPPMLKHAMKMVVGHLYENRELVSQSRTRGGFEIMPMAWQALIGPYIASYA